MTTEEKAKAYDKALKLAKELYNNPNSSSIGKEWLLAVFPEFAESEDEKIRKAISDIILIDSDEIREILDSNSLLMQDIDAWLEKQVEQKPQGKSALEAAKKEKIDNANKVESKFKAGDWSVSDTNHLIRKIVEVDNGYYTTDFGILPIEDYDRVFHLWTIQDAKDGDVLAVDNIIFIYERTLASHIVSYCKLINDVFESSLDARTCCEGNTYVHPATKEQRDLLFSKMKEAGYKWDAKKKELKKIEQWKPSKEQISVLSRSLKYIDKISSNYHHVLEGLLNNLRKLREE